MKSPPDDRSALATSYAWAIRVMTVSIEMVAPAVVGLWIDRRLKTLVLFTIIGLILGMSLGMWHLLKIARSADETPRRDNDETTGES